MSRASRASSPSRPATVPSTATFDGHFWVDGPRKAGKLDGLVRYWRERGELCATSEFRAGKRHGVLEQFDEAGQLEQRQRFKADQLDGALERYEGGVLVSRQMMRAGKQHGVSQGWDGGVLLAEWEHRAGREVRYVKYRDGEVVLRRTSHPNGKPAREEEFARGVRVQLVEHDAQGRPTRVLREGRAETWRYRGAALVEYALETAALVVRVAGVGAKARAEVHDGEGRWLAEGAVSGARWVGAWRLADGRKVRQVDLGGHGIRSDLVVDRASLMMEIGLATVDVALPELAGVDAVPWDTIEGAHSRTCAHLPRLLAALTVASLREEALDRIQLECVREDLWPAAAKVAPFLAALTTREDVDRAAIGRVLAALAREAAPRAKRDAGARAIVAAAKAASTSPLRPEAPRGAAAPRR